MCYNVCMRRLKVYTIEKICPVCKIEFKANKYRDQECCSRSCARTLQYKNKHAPNWRGGRIKTTTGYIDIWVGKDYPGAKRYGYYAEHRYIMEQYIGRSLERYETVHHINGDKTDNRLENLQLRTGNHGRGIVMKCNNCGSNDIISIEIKNAEA